MPFTVEEWWSRGHLSLPRYAWKLPLVVRQLYFELFYLAAYKPMADRRTGEMLEAAQYQCTRSFLAARMNITEGQVRARLDKLREAGAITTEGSRHGVKITITNYRQPKRNRNTAGIQPVRNQSSDSKQKAYDETAPERNRKTAGTQPESDHNPISVESNSAGSKDDDIAPDTYLKIIREQWQALGLKDWQWDEVALKWHRQGVDIRTAVAAMLLGAARGNGIVSLKYFEPIFPEARRILAESPSYFGYVREHIIGGR